MPDALCGPLLDRIGWTTGELARRLGIADATARDWASGRRTTPATVLAWLERVATAVDAAGLPEGWGGARPGRRPAA